MTMIVDLLRTGKGFSPIWNGHEQLVDTRLDGITVIDLNNVARFYYEVSEKDVWAIDVDFPNLAPPFREFWVEWREPTKVNRGGRIEEVRLRFGSPSGNRMGTAVGMLLESRTLEEGGWALTATLFCKIRKQAIGPLTHLFFKILPDGRVAESQIPGGWPAAIWDHTGFMEMYSDSEAEALVSASVDVFKVAALGISFMHCKNVVRKLVTPPTRLARARKRRKKSPLTSYYVLDINPMREVLETEGEASEHGFQKALHICRGHFATYTADAPLFGRSVGTFWKPQHVRGSASRGVALKDYRVNPTPQDTP